MSVTRRFAALALAAAAALALAAPAAARPPKGYQIVSSGSLGSPANQQVHGSVGCPSGKTLLGGGVFVTSSSVLVNVNSDYPSGNGWAADVNNASGAATTFSVYAICGNTFNDNFSPF